MKILGLFNNECALELFEWLIEQGHQVVLCSERLDIDYCRQAEYDLAVSYTYRYILSEQELEALNNNVVNIHNSYLPFNRGADPNLWSIVDNTPRGVTLHYMDSNLDKGYVIAQEFVYDNNNGNETLRSSYINLDIAAKQMFKKAFQYYKYWKSMKKLCIGKGTYHSLSDGKKIKELIDTYDMSIDSFRDKLRLIKLL